LKRMDARLEAQVWRRAHHRCEYCGFPAQLTHVPFQIDHIIAEKHRGATTLDNLALSCFFCNTFKGPNLAGVDPDTGEVTRLFHPRRDRWPNHFRWNGALLEGRTAVGRTTIDVLRINRADAIAVRRSLMEEGAL
jgi:5-methylcytosine-specific restriction endonuclease McrA